MKCMGTAYNIYCDESCHLEHDGIPVMLLGAVWCPLQKVKSISKQIRELKAKHNARGELKWTKISRNCQVQFYQSLLDFFFREENLNFRCLVVMPKNRLNHSYFNQGSHDSFYYKMYYQLLINIVTQEQCQFNIFLDIKDTRGSKRVQALNEILCTKLRDYEHTIIKNVQLIRSHESQLVQLSDFLLGAISYNNRDDIPKTNQAKLKIVEKLKSASGSDLFHSSAPWEQKFNLFIFRPQESNNGRAT